jgi:putative DNA methylase
MTDPPFRKKLVETALPLEAINVASRADKTRNVGTIRNIHKWFAPMPLPALRALILASVVDDPGNDGDRAKLFKLIEDLVGTGSDEPSDEILELARRTIKVSCDQLPVVLDPFCGGGSTLVEAQRLGLPSQGSDLNPIPVLISKSLAEYPHAMWDQDPLHQDPHRLPTSGWRGLAGFTSDVRYYANVIRDLAFQSIGRNYPLGPDGNPVFAWWWARTVPSPDPRFQGCLTPLVTSWWLTKQQGATQWLEPVVSTDRKIEFRVRLDAQPPEPSKSRCLFSNAAISFDYVRDQGRQGHLGNQMMAFVTLGNRTRINWPASEDQLAAAAAATPSAMISAPLPDGALGFRVQGYGMKDWHDLFLPRQRLTLETFAAEIAAINAQVIADGGTQEYARAIVTILGLSLGKLAQLHSTLVGWGPRNGPTRALTAFSQQVVSMTWDFCELNPFSGAQGDWLQTVETSLGSLSAICPDGPPAVVEQKDAREAKFPEKPVLIVTDPPYFEAIGYADLSDYFYPWLRLALREVYPDLFVTIGAPKAGELIANPYIHDSEADAKSYFIDGFREVFARLAEGRDNSLPMLIVYAHKETEVEQGGEVSSGWEAMLEAVTQAGLAVVATWPIHGAAAGRVRSRGSNALATYVVLVCRPRLESAERVSRREFVAKLRTDLAPAVKLLQSAAIAPVDMAQAVIGPGMGVFTGFRSVLESDGTQMSIRSALILINSILAEVLDEQEGEFDADTRWSITWFEQFQFDEAPSGEADSLARAKVTSIDGLERAGVVATRGGTCRLRRRDELSDDYDPARDTRATVWEAVQHLVKQLLEGGEEKAANLFAQLPNVETARDLAYRLYAICERKGWAEEGGAYNDLVVSWPEIAKLAQQLQTQQRLGGDQLPGLG